MNMRLFELNCQCSVFRGGVEDESKGQKGKLKRIIIREIIQCQSTNVQEQSVPELPLKQTSITQLYDKPQQKLLILSDKSNVSKPIYEESVYKILIFQRNEMLYEYEVKNILNINKNFINDGKLTLFVKDISIINSSELMNESQLTLIISNSTPQNLTLFLDQIIKIKFGNNNLSKQIDKAQIEVQSIEQEQEPKQILNEIQNINLKRKGIDVSQYQQKQIIPKQPVPQFIIKSYDFPKFLIRHVLTYLQQNQILQYRVLNKSFDEEVCHKIKIINFDRHTEIPIDILIRCLNKFQKVQEINLGRMKNIQAGIFQNQMILNLPNLKALQMGKYLQLTDKLADKILTKAERVEYLTLPYNSKITNNTLQFIKQKLSSLRGISLKSVQIYLNLDQNSIEHNDLIHERVLAQLILFRLGQIVSISIPSVHISLFETMMRSIQSSDSLQTLKTLKLKRIYVDHGETAAGDLTSFLSKAQGLEKLTIKNLNTKSGGIYVGSPDLCNAFSQSLMNIKNLKSLSVGSFCSDSICAQIGDNLLCLSTIKIQSQLVTDEGLEKIFLQCTRLENIDIRGCILINGHCFEALKGNAETFCQNLLNIKVQFDDYRAKFLKSILMDKRYVYELQNNKLKQKQ